MTVHWCLWTVKFIKFSTLVKHLSVCLLGKFDRKLQQTFFWKSQKKLEIFILAHAKAFTVITSRGERSTYKGEHTPCGPFSSSSTAVISMHKFASIPKAPIAIFILPRPQLFSRRLYNRLWDRHSTCQISERSITERHRLGWQKQIFKK